MASCWEWGFMTSLQQSAGRMSCLHIFGIVLWMLVIFFLNYWLLLCYCCASTAFAAVESLCFALSVPLTYSPCIIWLHGHHISYLVSSIPSRLCKFSPAWYIGSQHIHKLQCAQNSLSRVALSGRHREHLSASMRLSNIHWLPVRKRIELKLALTTYKILSTHQPAYLRSLLFPYEPTRACARPVSSCSMFQL